MKPLTHCPHCKAVLIKKTIPEHLNHTKYENCSARCAVDYFQYYKNSYDDPEIDYISFNTPDNKFFLYMHFDSYYKYQTLVYSTDTIKKYGTALPILYLPLDKYPLDVTKMDELYEKISTLALFV